MPLTDRIFGRATSLFLHALSGHRMICLQGWALHAEEEVSAHAFVCLYAGEYLTSQQAQMRLQQYDEASTGHALLVRNAPVYVLATCTRYEVHADSPALVRMHNMWLPEPTVQLSAACCKHAALCSSGQRTA